MNDAAADFLIALPQSRRAAEIRLALVHDGAQRPTALASLLAADGLPPNAGVIDLGRVDELAQATLGVIVLAADLSRPQSLAVRPLAGPKRPRRADRRRRPPRPSGALARQALNAGAEAFVAEQDAGSTLVAAVRAVLAGLVCAPRATRRLVAQADLLRTARSRCWACFVAGFTNRQIAARLICRRAPSRRTSRRRSASSGSDRARTQRRSSTRRRACWRPRSRRSATRRTREPKTSTARRATGGRATRDRNAPMTPPRVLMITPDFPPAPGGIQRVAHRLATNLSAVRSRVLTIDAAGARLWDAGRNTMSTASPPGAPIDWRSCASMQRPSSRPAASGRRGALDAHRRRPAPRPRSGAP